MANELKDIRLYNVHTAGNVYHSGIKAESVNKAMEIATANCEDKTVYDITCSKIYEASIGTEAVGPDAKFGDDIFEINIRGTNSQAVDKLKELIAKFIGGRSVEFEYGEDNIDRAEAARHLAYFIDGLELSVESL